MSLRLQRLCNRVCLILMPWTMIIGASGAVIIEDLMDGSGCSGSSYSTIRTSGFFSGSMGSDRKCSPRRHGSRSPRRHAGDGRFIIEGLGKHVLYPSGATSEEFLEKFFNEIRDRFFQIRARHDSSGLTAIPLADILSDIVSIHSLLREIVGRSLSPLTDDMMSEMMLSGPDSGICEYRTEYGDSGESYHEITCPGNLRLALTTELGMEQVEFTTEDAHGHQDLDASCSVHFRHN